MFKNFPIIVDTVQKSKLNNIVVNSNDLKTIKLSLTINQLNKPIDLTGATVRIAIVKPDKKTVFQDCTITDPTTGSCEVILNTQAFIISGVYIAEVMIYFGADTVAVTGRFSYSVAKGILDDSTAESTNEWQSITQAIADAEGILIDLRENGTGIDVQARTELETVTTQLAENVTDIDLQKKRTRNSLNISEFESYVINGDWALAINKAFGMYADATSPYYQKRIRIKFDSDASYTIKSTINYNPKWVEWDARGSKIKTSGIGTGGFMIALKIDTGDQYGTNNNLQSVNLGIFIEGEGRDKVGTIGVSLENCADFLFIGMRSQNFESAIHFSNNAYILTFLHCVFVGEYAINFPSGKVNYGERLSFIDCSFGGSYGVLNNSIYGSLHIKSCSFDYGKKGIVKSNKGITILDDCHFEFESDLMTESPFQISGEGSMLTVRGGWLLNTKDVTNFQYIVEGDGNSKFEDMKFHNLRTLSGQFASDTGIHEVIIGSTNTQQGFNFAKIQSSHNALLDGSFEEASIVDLVWVRSGTITDRWNSDHMKLELDTTNFKSGTKSLKVTKLRGANITGTFALGLPLNRFDRVRKFPFIEWSKAKLNTVGAGGTVTIKFYWANLLVTSDTQPPKVLKSVLASQTDNVFNNAAVTNWSKSMSYGDNKILYNPPGWATHIMMEFQAYNYDGANGTAPFNLDEVHFEMV